MPVIARSARAVAGAAAIAIVAGVVVGRFAPGPAARGPGVVAPAQKGDWWDAIPPGQWVEIPTVGDHPGFRWTHSGAVYVPPRNALLMFGADTHLHSFDNAVYELELQDRRWVRHRRASPPWSLRTDALGRRIAGFADPAPWPMHVYDAMVFDPRGGLRVISGAKHSFVPAPGAQQDPGWLYDPQTRRWQRAPAADGLPNFFATGAVYDSRRDTIIGYASLTDRSPFLPLGSEDRTPRSGVWELGPDRQAWRLATPERHHWGWFNAEYDRAHDVMLVFGGRAGPGVVWAYRPGERPGEAGDWARLLPGGDACPGGSYLPAAYDTRRGVTLVVPRERGLPNNATCVYDYGANRWTRLPGADLPVLGLNYTMVYAESIDTFVLVAGGYFQGERTRVLALRLPAVLP